MFAKITVRYGAKWLGLWEGVPLEAVRADWAEVLDGMQAHNGAALLYGLENLPPDFPPTATEFRAICNRRPDPPTPRLEAPRTVNHEAVAKLREKVGEFAAAADVRRREREAAEMRSRPRTVVVPPELQRAKWAPQGPLPWPRGVPRPDEASA